MNTNEPEKVNGFIYEAPTFNFIESVKVMAKQDFLGFQSVYLITLYGFQK